MNQRSYLYGKSKDMKTGTFGVKSFKEIKVKKQDIIDFEKINKKTD